MLATIITKLIGLLGIFVDVLEKNIQRLELLTTSLSMDTNAMQEDLASMEKRVNALYPPVI